MKTAKEVQTEIMALLRGTTLIDSTISGMLYRSGYRPRDSKKEDAVVIFTTGLPGQIQTGVVAINIYVPDIPLANGLMVENGARCDTLEKAAQAWVDTLTAHRSDYIFEQQQTIYTEADPDIQQHFIVVKLKYKFY
jgi:hypothetical protein